MPGIGDPGPSGIASPNPAQLVQPIGTPVVTPDAVRTMTEAFRAGQISAQDIIDRVGELGQAKKKAEINVANLQGAQAAAALPLVSQQAATTQATLEAQAAQAQAALKNNQLSTITQANKLKHENAVAMMGENGKLIDAAYTSIGRLIPMKEDPSFPGVSVPDLDTIKEELPKINAFARVQSQKAALDAAWQPSKVTFKDAQGKEIVAEGWVNAISGEKSPTRPMPKALTFDTWMQSQAPGSVQALPVSAVKPVVTPVAAAPAVPTDLELGAARARMVNAGAEPTAVVQMTPQQLTPQLPAPVVQPVATATAQPAPVVQPAVPTSLAGTPYEGWRVSEVKEAPAEQTQQIINNASQRYQANQTIMGLNNAKQAYDATKDVLDKVNPDGSYAAGLTATPKQADYKLMVSYAKILDPNSVVREGEITLLAGTKSQWGRLEDLRGKPASSLVDYVQAMTGQKIFTNTERQGITSLLTGAYQNRIAAAKEIRDNSAIMLKQAGATDAQINAALPFPAQTPAAAGATPTVQRVGPPIPLKSGRTVQRGADGNYYNVP